MYVFGIIMGMNIKIIGTPKLNATAKNMKKLRKRLLSRMEKEANSFGNDAVAIIKSRYLTGPRPNKLGVVTNELRSSIRFKVQNTNQGLGIRFGTDVQYAPVHEYGDTVHPTVTNKMRSWAWAKFFETGDTKFKAIALTKKNTLDIRIRERPFLEPGVTDGLKAFRKNVLRGVKEESRRSMSGRAGG